MTKLISSVWTVFVMAISVSIVILSWAYFQKMRPNLTAASYADSYANALETEGNKQGAATQRAKDAVKLRQVATDKWNAYVASHTPSTSLRGKGIDVSENPYQLLIDTRYFRNNVQRAVNAQVRTGGVEVVYCPEVPGPSEVNDVSGLLADYYHFGPIKFPIVIYNLGQVVVRGTYDQIAANVRSYKFMPNYLAVADGLAITGTSPKLTGTYNLTMVGFIRGNKLFGPVPEEAGAAGAGGGTGRGGFPGMPGGAGGLPGMPGGRGGFAGAAGGARGRKGGD